MKNRAYANREKVQHSEKEASAVQFEERRGVSIPPPEKESPSGENDPSGIPLSLKAKLEQTIGQDFSHVQNVPDSKSAEEADALAMARGNTVHYAPGQFKPETPQGQALIGHEYAHIGQQAEGRVPTTTLYKGLPVNNDPQLEGEADRIGQRVASMKLPEFSGAPLQRKSGSGAQPFQLKGGSLPKEEEREQEGGITEEVLPKLGPQEEEILEEVSVLEKEEIETGPEKEMVEKTGQTETLTEKEEEESEMGSEILKEEEVPGLAPEKEPIKVTDTGLAKEEEPQKKTGEKESIPEEDEVYSDAPAPPEMSRGKKVKKGLLRFGKLLAKGSVNLLFAALPGGPRMAQGLFSMMDKMGEKKKARQQMMDPELYPKIKSLKPEKEEGDMTEQEPTLSEKTAPERGKAPLMGGHRKKQGWVSATPSAKDKGKEKEETGTLSGTSTKLRRQGRTTNLFQQFDGDEERLLKKEDRDLLDFKSVDHKRFRKQMMDNPREGIEDEGYQKAILTIAATPIGAALGGAETLASLGLTPVQLGKLMSIKTMDAEQIRETREKAHLHRDTNGLAGKLKGFRNTFGKQDREQSEEMLRFQLQEAMLDRHSSEERGIFFDEMTRFLPNKKREIRAIEALQKIQREYKNLEGTDARKKALISRTLRAYKLKPDMIEYAVRKLESGAFNTQDITLVSKLKKTVPV